MTDTYVTEVLNNIDTITERLDANKLITKTRDAVQKGIKKFQITPAEQAKLYANFEMNFSVAIVQKLIDVTIQSGLIEQQIEMEKKKIDLITQQIETEVQNTLKTTAELELLGENKRLVEAQVETQKKQKLDVMAGINIKNQQAKATLESARFEEARRHILIDSTLFNNQINKSKEENALLNALAVDDKFVITDTHLLRVRNAMDGITTTKTTYTTGLAGTVPQLNPVTETYA